MTDQNKQSEWLKHLKTYVTRDNVDSPMNQKFQPTALHLAAKKGDSEAIQWLVEELGANIHKPDGYMETPLCDAVRDVNVGAVRQLLKYGARVEENFIWMPLRCVLRSSYVDIKKRAKVLGMLLDHGAYLNWVPREYQEEWAQNLVNGRENCRNLCTILLGIRRFRYSLLDKNAIDIIKVIAKTIWNGRNAEVWQKTQCN